MFKIIKKLRNFSAAHRLIKGYEGPCKNLHGHNYAIEITLCTDQLDSYGFVMDFHDIKIHLDQWVQDHWDHVTIVSEIDKPLLEFLKKEKQTYFLISGDKNTSAETLAEFLFHQFSKILTTLNTSAILESVRIFESETASAVYNL